MPLDPGTFKRILALSGTEPHAFEAIAPEPADSLAELERKYAGASPEVKEAISRRIERGPVAEKVKEATGHRCQVCLALGLAPIAFLKKDGQPYVEAHHVTFVSRLEPGTLGPSNIITVCPNHHRQLHYGNADLVSCTVGEFVFRLDGAEVRVPRVTVPLDV
jgi:predicted restriction endonuclease